jgi:CDGSH iron-sulfur domain-containing protein 3
MGQESGSPPYKPVVMTLTPGHYSWCTCAHTKTEPFCDGSHIGKGMCPLTMHVETAKTVSLCTCKETNTPPYCDGSHHQLRG